MHLREWLTQKVLSNFYTPITALEHHQHKGLELRKAIYDLLLRIEKDLQNLKEAVQDRNVIEKNARVSELENKFILLQGKADSVMDTLRLITRIENKLDDVVSINDTEQLTDKIDRVEAIRKISRYLQSALSQNPSIDELNKQTLNELYQQTNKLIVHVNAITADDEYLLKKYQRLRGMIYTHSSS